jgi:hypothetical protein
MMCYMQKKCIKKVAGAKRRTACTKLFRKLNLLLFTIVTFGIIACCEKQTKIPTKFSHT